MTRETIAAIDCFPLAIPRDEPYLGKLEDGVAPNAKGYFVRPGNRSLYSLHDHCLLIRITTGTGRVGWGECVTVVGPEVAATIVRDLLAPLVIGQDPMEVATLYEDLYDAMRVRGFFGGFYMDAVAAVDIALWDLRGKICDQPIAALLGSRRHERIPAYVSGLPKPTLEERARLAREWSAKGFDAIKFAAAIAHQGEVEELRQLRETVGDGVRILCDMHWKHSAAVAIRLIRDMEPYGLYLAEAPVRPEDINGQAEVVRGVDTPVGIGEELRTTYEYLPRFQHNCMDVIQPEMGRMGITAMWRVCQMALAHNKRVMPHASIGIGIFQAASLHVTAGLPNCPYHEYQHSIFDRYLPELTGDMRCADGYFQLPGGPGLGVEPKESILQYAIPFSS